MKYTSRLYERNTIEQRTAYTNYRENYVNDYGAL